MQQEARSGSRRWRHGLVASSGAITALLLPAIAASAAFYAIGGIPTLVLPGFVAGVTLAASVALGLRRPSAGWWALGLALGSVLSLGWWILAAQPVGPSEQPRPSGTEFWHLPSGSTIAYERIPSRDAAPSESPVLFLHGGPGVAEAEQLRALVHSLDLGDRDSYIYDQVGVGDSSRLPPKAYGTSRDVIDLEEIRQAIRAPRVILIGHSYGAYLAASYAAEHPGRVERMALVSPGPLDWNDHSPDRLFDRLSTADRRDLFAYALGPRQLSTYVLSQLDASRARGVVSDAEADAMSDELTARASAALYCDAPTAPLGSTTGHFRMQTDPLPPSRPESEALERALRDVDVPTVILKGSCDYLSWQSATDYQRLIGASRLCYVDGAGHNLLEERQDLVPGLLRRFLQGEQPCAADRPPTMPATYEGPERG